jgi:hypothetical protein
MRTTLFLRRAALSMALVLSSCAVPKPIPDRVGIYLWGALPLGPDPLLVAADDARTLGTHVVRICLSPYWDPRPNSPDRLLPLDQKVQRSDYQAVLKEFPAVMITAYDAASYRKRATTSDADWEAMIAGVREEFRRFTVELAKLPNVYIVSNWEAENDVPDDQWPDYLAYLQARLDGIVAGRREARQAGEPGRVLTAVEFTHVNPGFTYVFDPTPPRKACGLDAAMLLTGVDFLSYSSWESVVHTDDRTYTVAKLRGAFGVIRQKCATSRRQCRLIVGEIGYLRDHDPDNWNLNMLLSESLNAGAEYTFNWVAYDQPGQTDPFGFNADQSLFGKFTLARQLTPQGAFFLRFLRPRTVQRPFYDRLVRAFRDVSADWYGLLRLCKVYEAEPFQFGPLRKSHSGRVTPDPLSVIWRCLRFFLTLDKLQKPACPAFIGRRRACSAWF